VSPERPEDDDFLEDDEHEEYGQRSIFATGWFRAVLVLLVLAVIAVIAVPLIGGWFEPTPPPKVTTTRPAEPTPPPTTPAPTTPKVETPATPPPAAQAPAPTPTPTPTPPPATPAPVTPPPAVSTPPARPEMPAASTPSKAAEKAKAPERTAAATGKSASKAAAAGGSYWVQVGAFKESKNAEGLARTLRSEGFTVQVASVTRGEPLHVVRVGGFADRGKATAAREELQGKGHSGFVTQGPAK
jgi:septal ring-binding cell division protein DamX